MTFAVLVGKLSLQTNLGFIKTAEIVKLKLKRWRTNIETKNRHIPCYLYRPHPPLHTRDSHRPQGPRNPVLHLNRPLNLRTRNDSPQSLHRHIH